jgi:hypothetical protein
VRLHTNRWAGVVNASAYRAFLLAAAWRAFGVEAYREASERNIEFVLGTQHEDGSWPYAVDGTRDFVDHFHTCFVLKGWPRPTPCFNVSGVTQPLRRELNSIWAISLTVRACLNLSQKLQDLRSIRPNFTTALSVSTFASYLAKRSQTSRYFFAVGG